MQGRQLQRNLTNIDLVGNFRQALENLGYNLDEIYEEEPEQGLGTSGLGRLSVCMMEGLTTLQVPVIGYGLRYDFGSFVQRFDENGEQVEIPDFWVSKGVPWEIARQDVCYKIFFGGKVQPLSESPSDYAR